MLRFSQDIVVIIVFSFFIFACGGGGGGNDAGGDNAGDLPVGDNNDYTPEYKIPDTGQTQSHTSIFGEDSDYTHYPPSFTKLDADNNELPDSASLSADSENDGNFGDFGRDM